MLSSCSPVLRKILLEMSDPDPVFDMKGMTMEEISLLLKFIYTGEVMVMMMMMMMLLIVIVMTRACFMIMLTTRLLFVHT